jgi:hypothetical protein
MVDSFNRIMFDTDQYPRYTSCNWEARTNFGHEFHKKKMFVSTCVQKHWVCELLLKEYCADTSSSSALMCGRRDWWWLVHPHVLPHRLADNHYRDFLLHDLPKLLEDVPLAVTARMWYIHDGAPAHFSRAVRDVLSNTIMTDG